MSGSDDQPAGSERRKLAEHRTIMAVERTYAGWMRTALAAIGIGLGFHALFGELQPPWLARAIASLFILLGAVLAIGAERRAGRSFKRMSTHSVSVPEVPSLRWIAYCIALGATVLVGALWLSASSGAP